MFAISPSTRYQVLSLCLSFRASQAGLADSLGLRLSQERSLSSHAVTRRPSTLTPNVRQQCGPAYSLTEATIAAQIAAFLYELFDTHGLSPKHLTYQRIQVLF